MYNAVAAHSLSFYSHQDSNSPEQTKPMLLVRLIHCVRLSLPSKTCTHYSTVVIILVLFARSVTNALWKIETIYYSSVNILFAFYVLVSMPYMSSGTFVLTFPFKRDPFLSFWLPILSTRYILSFFLYDFREIVIANQGTFIFCTKICLQLVCVYK